MIIANQRNPKLFISYSWSSQEHEQWVLQLATELRESGVDVIFDKWDLKEGHDADVFMEKMVIDQEVEKVMLVCDRVYAEKADKRKGGVGTEGQIISKKIYEQVDQSKFVAVISEKDDMGKPYLPIYYSSRIYIDFSSYELYSENFERLLRWIFDRPLHVKPKLGKMPEFLNESGHISLGTSVSFKRAVDAIRNNRGHAKGALNEYLQTFSEGIEQFRIIEKDAKFDDQVIENIERFIPHRNELIEIFILLAQYRDIESVSVQIHHFFEDLIKYFYPLKENVSYSGCDFDNFKFIIQELFLYSIAVFLKHECFESVNYLLSNSYYVAKKPGDGHAAMYNYSVFRNYLESLKYRNTRLGLRRLSLHSDLLKERCKGTSITLDQLMQADFVLFLRDAVNRVLFNLAMTWWPETLLYKALRSQEPFEIFLRAESIKYFDRMKCILGITAKGELEPVVKAFKSGNLLIPKWQFEQIDPVEILNYEKLFKHQ
ncbi:MAG: TIR domain-containing protein [Candidatus Omnitrophica bacterium]|nr:TIR domain-containing protein [Candidatus Omnitrophota bacterium]